MFFEKTGLTGSARWFFFRPGRKNLKAKIVGIEKELARATNNNVAILKKELAEAKKNRKTLSSYLSAIKKLLPMQRRDFEQIFTTMDGLPNYDTTSPIRLFMNFCRRKNTIKRNGKTNEDQP